MKRRQDVLIRCPFYKNEDRQKIVCEGVRDGTALHLTFDANPDLSKLGIRDYKTVYCKGRWEDCLIAQMLNKKYE